MARQALQHAVVRDGLARGLVILLGLHDGHPKILALHQVAQEGARVFRQLAHQDGLVDPVQPVGPEDRLEAMEGLGGLGEDQHAGGVAVQAMDDEELEALEAPPAVMVREGFGEIGLLALLRRHREEPRGLVDEDQVVVLEEHLEARFVQGLPGLGQGLVDPRRIEADGDLVPRLQAQAVAVGLGPVHLHAARVHQALGLPVTDFQDGVEFGGQRPILAFGLPGLAQTCHVHLRARRSSERCAIL